VSADAPVIERADALRRDGKPVEALRLLDRAIAENPLDFALFHHAGRSALEAKQYRAAINYLEFFLRAEPDNWKAVHRIGTAHFNLGEYDRAGEAMERVLAQRPDLVPALIPYGFCPYALGFRDEGYAAHSRALSLPAGNPKNSLGQALLRITRGDWGGWEQFEARWLVPSEYPHPEWSALDAQRWTGEEAPDRTLWLHPEGGLGDSIMFSRFIPMAAKRVGRVVFSAPRPLRRLLEPMDGLAALVDPKVEDPRRPEYLHAGIWSMPHHLGLSAETLPRVVPYLRPPADGPRLPERAPGTRLRVGIVWSGNPNADHDCDRSIPRPELLAPLWEVPGVEWVSLQVGARSEWAAGFPVTVPPPLRDFADTAYLLPQLDLTVSVDTSTANLAGAMGLPVWVFIPTLPEFRWPLDHPGRTPWYPTARTFSRDRSADWPGVIARVAAALREERAAAR